jgi:hypothetical protein
MALDIEKKIETAWIALLEANTYVITNAIPVRSFRDNSKNMTGYIIEVHANLVRQEFPKSTLWESVVDIMGVTYQADDRDQGIVEDLYQECLYVMKNTTISELSTAGDITFNGITMLDPGDQLFDENGRFQSYMLNVQCHVQE